MGYARHRPRDGYTLVEMAVVLVIFAIIVAVAVPSMSQGNAWRRVDGAGRDLAARAQMARQMAILKRTPYRMVIDRMAKTYNFERQVSSTTWVADPDQVYSLDDVFWVSTMVGGSLNGTQIVFETQGTLLTSQAPAQIALYDTHGDRSVVTFVRTGRITTKMVPVGS
jgi:type II secretion system protein H